MKRTDTRGYIYIILKLRHFSKGRITRRKIRSVVVRAGRDGKELNAKGHYEAFGDDGNILQLDFYLRLQDFICFLKTSN